MSKNHKEKVTLQSGEAYVVAPYHVWDHVVRVYESQIKHEDDEWAQMAGHFRYWADSTLYLELPEDDCDW